MKSAMDISLFDLGISFSALLIPIAFLLYYKVKIVKDILIGAARMVIQLSLVAIYLEWIFNLNNAWVNCLWILIMISVGVYTSIKRIGLNWRYFILPFFTASIISVIIIDTFFLGFIIKLDNIFDARYFVPITGMILGNSLNHNIVGLTTYLKGFTEKSELYYFLLTNSSSFKITLRPFITEAIKRGLNPLIASMSVIGLISLPGMMTGQILGGSSPVIAIKYQIMIMLAIFVGCSINLLLSIIFSNYVIFDSGKRLKNDFLKNN